MLQEYSQFLIIIDPVLQFIFWLVMPLVGIYLAYVVAKRLSLKQNNKGYFLRVFIPAITFGLISLIFAFFCVQAMMYMETTICEIGNSSMCGMIFVLMLVFLFYGIPASIILFIIGLFLFRKPSISTEGVYVPYLNKTNKVIFIIYILIFIYTFLFYLIANIYRTEVSIITTEVKELNATEEKLQFKSKAMEYAKKHAENNQFLCITNEMSGLHVWHFSYFVINNELYHRLEYHEPDQRVAMIEGDKITAIETDEGTFEYINHDCYNNKSEKMDEKYEIIQHEQYRDWGIEKEYRGEI